MHMSMKLVGKSFTKVTAALQNLQKDYSHTILTVDKQVALVMEKDMYIDNCMTLLDDENVYKEIVQKSKSIPMYSSKFWT